MVIPQSDGEGGVSGVIGKLRMIGQCFKSPGKRKCLSTVKQSIAHLLNEGNNPLCPGLAEGACCSSKSVIPELDFDLGCFAKQLLAERFNLHPSRFSGLTLFD